MPFRRVFAALLVALLAACSKKNPPPPPAAPPSELRSVLVAGLNAFEQGQVKEALAHFGKAVALRPAQFEAQLNLANTQLRADQPEPAMASAQAALHLEKDSAAAHYLLGCGHARLGRAAEAIAAFQASLKIAPGVAAVHFQLGQAHLTLAQSEAAEAAFRQAIALEPAHRAAHYALSQTLTRLGRAEDAAQSLAKHQDVNSGQIAGITNATFFEKCVHTEPLLPAIESEQPAAPGVAVQFVDITSEVFGGKTFRGPAEVIDPNHDFRHGLVAFDETGVRILRNDGGKLAAAGEPIAPLADAKYAATLVGDLNNDGFEDALLLADKGAQVLLFGKDGAVRDASRSARLGAFSFKDGALVDFDFTGKLGLAAVASDGAVKIFRNEGPARFAEVSAKYPPLANFTAATSVALVDWNGDDRPDLLGARADAPPFLLLNKPRAAPDAPGAPPLWPKAVAVAAADFDNDLRADLAAAVEGGILVSFGARQEMILGASATQLVAFDYDNDGWLDLLAAADAGLRAWRNLGRAGFRETTADLALPGGAIIDVKTADFDLDGDSDLLLESTDRVLRLLRNDGANANAQLKLRLPGKRSNASGIGVGVELRAGGWRTLRTAARLPIEIGTGQHRQLDLVRLHWTDLVANAGSLAVDASKPLVFSELELPTGSCPNLYAWDGAGFRFITDFLGAAPLGLPVSEERFVEAEPDELLHVGDDVAFPPRGDAFVIAVTSELREVLYLDHAQLVVADHPPGTEIHSTSKLLPSRPPGGWPEPRLVALKKKRPLLAASTTTFCRTCDKSSFLAQGDAIVIVPKLGATFCRRCDKRLSLVDCTVALAERDGAMASPPALRAPQLRGLAEPWSVELDFGPLDPATPLVLALTGWLRFGGGMANIAGAHDVDLPFPFPQLEAQTATGAWEKIAVAVGAPAGKTKTILVELEGKLPPSARRLRFSTAFEIHWDRIALFERAATPPRTVALAPRGADLRWHGFGEYEPPRPGHPLTPRHDRVAGEAPWRITPTGWCTRYGDARALLAERDDALAILNGGDELALEFPTAALPEKPAGWMRSLFFQSTGWDKDADHHIAHGWTVEPLPWRGLDDQRYGHEPRPARPAADALMRALNTRWVGPAMLSHGRAR